MKSLLHEVLDIVELRTYREVNKLYIIDLPLFTEPMGVSIAMHNWEILETICESCDIVCGNSLK